MPDSDPTEFFTYLAVIFIPLLVLALWASLKLMREMDEKEHRLKAFGEAKLVDFPPFILFFGCL